MHKDNGECSEPGKNRNRSQEFMPSEARLKFLQKMIILGPKTAILGPQFCRIWCWGLIFGGWGAQVPPGSAPVSEELFWEHAGHMVPYLGFPVAIVNLFRMHTFRQSPSSAGSSFYRPMEELKIYLLAVRLELVTFHTRVRSPTKG